MLQVTSSKRTAATGAIKPTEPSNPPQIVLAPQPDHPIWGPAPIDDESKLESQSIHVLDLWHRRANDLLKPWHAPGEINDAEEDAFQVIHAAQWQIYRAAQKATLHSAGDVHKLLSMTVRHAKTNGSEIIDADWLATVVDVLGQVTAFPSPTKRIGALSKGSKLTRAGLLHRYHAFLIGELNTLGWSFYGSRDYPQTMIPFDDAVNARTKVGFKDGKYDPSQNRRKRYPFFDESKLTDRARSVLKSLKIDTENKGIRR